MQAEEILIGCFVECQSIKKVGGRRSVEGLYQALFFVSPVPPECFTATSSPGPSPRSKWRSEKPLAKAAEILQESWSILSRDT